MFWIKNIPGWERGLRVAAGAGLIVAGGLAGPLAWKTGLILGGGIAILTAIVGFCPACALVGRRLDRRLKG
ncbi:hypothetical protein GCM10011497_25210 [Elstera cyanobacteriorum]|uniref:Inner membrane protein YgaP-like transmembrane domain-containing protein n=1 Tax=Elstera cyanobacteriorum TaxID=2022747 RepID=A0A255XM27_9PROT|nr:DUF2892 domain-containing protein [Elstera cyanobacteriorum]OYQ17454.1 hypothetical protein CHR90_16010 [Elstera cyanobacteriorum]GFZ94069.1 hypothetical protein GCM10011497_25210 [Elstera cyanobacteriorum]